MFPVSRRSKPFLHRLRRSFKAALLALTVASAAAADVAEDHRAWQHGVNVIRVGERWLVVWGSAGNPPHPNLGGDWQHDVYYAWLGTTADGESALGETHVLVSRPEAQEPPSVAINATGTLLMSTEDGSDGINQFAGMWDASLRVLRPYPFMVRRGGHSGHVAAMGERFLIAYGEGWVERGGFLGRGTGQDIHSRIIEKDGKRRKETRIASGHRDGWPLVAASSRNWLVVWQRYPEMTLHSALVHASGRAAKPRQISRNMPVRYAYDVGFVPELMSFVVAGSSAEEGFVARVNLDGKLESIQYGLPPMASESRMLTHCDGGQCIAVYPVRPKGIAVLRLRQDGADLLKIIDHPHEWDYMGTSGAFVSPDRLVFATLSKTGIKLVTVTLQP